MTFGCIMEACGGELIHVVLSHGVEDIRSQKPLTLYDSAVCNRRTSQNLWSLWEATANSGLVETGVVALYTWLGTSVPPCPSCGEHE